MNGTPLSDFEIGVIIGLKLSEFNNFRIEKILKSHNLRVLKEFMSECEEFMDEDTYFQQDNARPHTGRLVLDYFESKSIKLLPWASQSPDINPIEGIWNILKWKVERQVENFDDFEEYLQFVKRTFLEDKEINKQIQKFIDNIPNKLNQIIENNGSLIS